MKLVFIVKRTGTTQDGEAEAGVALMEPLREAGLVDAVCGGSMACGTCAVRVLDPWCDALPPAGEAEMALLEGLGIDEKGCRLSCQVVLDESLSDMNVEVLQGC